jgi:hypothetical protein
VVAATQAATVLFVHSRGLPLPGPGGAAGASGIGWPPLAVGRARLLAAAGAAGFPVPARSATLDGIARLARSVSK